MGNYLSLCIMLFASQFIAQEKITLTFTLNNKPTDTLFFYFEKENYALYTINGSVQIPFVRGEETMTIRLTNGKSFQESIKIELPQVYSIPLLHPINEMNQVSVTSKKNDIEKKNDVISIEVVQAKFLLKNKQSNLFESLNQLNGVRPQVNCNICNTGDIHLNGLEGPYTMILIDGMPMMGSLASVYGLSGIPTGLIEKIELIKGPASTEYGSEALGGVINVITKKPRKKTQLGIDLYGTSLQELNADVSLALKWHKNLQSITGINYFLYHNPIDLNKDNFTDLTLQQRISIFHNLYLNLPKQSLLNVGGRFYYEDRWGGEMQWNKTFRGTDSIYGESIYTTRGEMFFNYKLPEKTNLNLMGSFNYHRQNSYYGTTPFFATQKVAFAQLNHNFIRHRWHVKSGLAFKTTHYDDNTFGTYYKDSLSERNQPNIQWVPGIFSQAEFAVSEKIKLVLGYRIDYQTNHGLVHSPRLGLKWNTFKYQTLRINYGTGYRIVQIFTEDHAALTGGRTTEIVGNIKPERSHSINLNYETFTYHKNHILRLDFNPFITYFSNKIQPDYTTDLTKIIYRNSQGFLINYGLNLQIDYKINGFSALIGFSLLDNLQFDDQNVKTRPLFTENFSANWTLSYQFQKLKLDIDYTGNVYAPMELPLASSLDPRSRYSPWYSIHNLQFTKELKNNFKIYLSFKNLLNWLPTKGNPFLIARSHDPFDKKVQFDSQGNVLASSENPYALTFDPSYVYAANQGFKLMLGIQVNF